MNMCPTNKCKSTPESCLKGQVFFILTNCSTQEVLKSRISLLGGKVEEFLSKDVTTLLVEDNQLNGQELLPDLSVKTTYNAVNGTIVATFPYPGTLTNVPSTSRGYNLLATNTSNKYTPYRLICYARQYGIQVVGIAQFLTWTEPQIKVIRQKQPRKASENVSNLSGYFIKFESVNKNYRPCYKMFNNDPDRLVPLKNASVLVKPDACNVILNKPVVTKHLHFMDSTVRPTHQVKGANLPVRANDKKPQNNRPRPKEDNNYCECCKTHFADFKQHIKSSKHQSFVSNDKNYESVHNILKMLPTAQEFIENLQKPSPNSDPALTNGDNSASMPVANVPETDYSVPLNLEVRRENVTGPTVQVNTHIGKSNGNNHHMKKEEVMPLPLDLHVKRTDEIKVEIKQETNLYDNCEQMGLFKKDEINLLQLKQEPDNEILMSNIKMDEKQPNELVTGVQCDEVNGDFLDKTNTAEIAQLCLKNFDSYWLDSLPCEVEDMEFDDIFAIDDGKTKVDDEGFGTFVDNIVNSEVPQTPGLVSGISNSNLKTDNTSIFMNTSVDVKDFIKTEPSNQESFLSTCKLGKENETSVSPLNIAVSFNEAVTLENKKPIFSIASFCSDKIGIEVTPSCSNTIPSKNLEPLFSSESSDDDENGNVLISNALNFITNSDNEGKADKESSEENSAEEKFKVDTLLKKDSVLKSNQPEAQLSAVKNIPDSSQVETKLNKGNSTSAPNPPVTETNMPIKTSHGSNISNTESGKFSFQGSANIPKVKNSNPDELKHPNVTSSEKCKIYNNKDNRNINLENSANTQTQKDSTCVTNVDTQQGVSNLSAHHTTESLASSVKNYTNNRKDNNSSEKEWDYTCNKIYKKYPVPLNRSLDNAKVPNDKTPSKDKEISMSSQNKHVEDPKINKKSCDKYPNPKKNISMREMAVKQSNSGESSFSLNTSISEGANQFSNPTVTPGKNECLNKITTSKTEKTSEVSIDKKEKANVVSAKTLPSDRKVDQISFKPYITDNNTSSYDKKALLQRSQNPERKVPSISYTGDILAKSSVSNDRTGQSIYTNVNPVKNISPIEMQIPYKQELILPAKSNSSASTTDTINLTSPNKNIGNVNALSLKKNEKQGRNAVSPPIKNLSSEREVIIKPPTVNYPNVPPVPIKSASFENPMNYTNYNFITHQNIPPEERVGKNINQIAQANMNLTTIDLSCLTVSPVRNKSKSGEAYCDAVTSAKNAHLPERKVSSEKKSNSGTKEPPSSSNAKITSASQNSNERQTSTIQNPKATRKNHDGDFVTDLSCSASDKNINSQKSQCQTDITNRTVASVKPLHFPDDKVSIKEEKKPPENITLNISNTSTAPANQIPWRGAPNVFPYDMSAPIKNVMPQGEAISHKDQVITEYGLNLSSSKTANHVVREKTPKPSGDFTSIKSLISRDESPGERKHSPEPQVCASSKVISSTGNDNSGENTSTQHSLTVNEPVNKSLQPEKHSDKVGHKSDTNLSTEIPKTVIVSEKQTLPVGSQNQISNDVASHSKNLQSQEEEKKRTSTQTSVKLNITNTSASGNASSAKQVDTLPKKILFKQDHRKRKDHTETTNYPSSSNTNVSFNERKEHCTNYEYFVPFKRKKAHRKEKKVRKKIKLSSVNKQSVKEVKIKSFKGQLSRSSTNQCQYSYRTAKYNMDTSSSALPVKSSMGKQTLKIPHKKQSTKLRDLPPLWTVSVNGVKLKFTRVYPKKVDTYQYVTEDDSD